MSMLPEYGISISSSRGLGSSKSFSVVQLVVEELRTDDVLDHVVQDEVSLVTVTRGRDGYLVPTHCHVYRAATLEGLAVAPDKGAACCGS